MKHKIWLHLLAIPGVSFGTVFVCNVLFDVGLSDFGGLLMMGMLLIGWPAVSVWLGCVSGKDLKKLWFLPILFALTMPPVFPYPGAGIIAWLYAGGVLVMGLIGMVGTKLTQ